MPKVVFVADLFAEDYTGGAELTTEALIEACPYEYDKIHAKDIDIDFLKQNYQSYFIFGNFSQLNLELVPTIISNCRYSILEYDYKFCKYRSIERHKVEGGEECNCHESILGKYISAFYFGAEHMFWMSEAQRNIYTQKFPFLENKGTVLSSVFSKKSLSQFRFLGNANNKKAGWLIQDSDSWIKGTDQSIAWAQENNKPFSLFKDLSHHQLLMKFYNAEGFIFLPKGGDTCPRVVLEAKLLGCDLQLNDNVQHASESWFKNGDVESILLYLENRPVVFWDAISRTMDVTSTLSGYTTTFNCVTQKYPFVESIKSMLDFCDEVVVVDAGSTDNTIQVLNQLAEDNEKLKVYVENIDFNHPRWAIASDGNLKAKARSLCTSDWCWQMDSDEVVHSGIRDGVQKLMQIAPKNYDILALPVVEYWGSQGKIRADINPWKWRLSRNKEHITHGIPKELRAIDANGHLYALKGTDSCDYIHNETYERLPHTTFYTKEVDEVRIKGLQGDAEYLKIYNDWVNQTIENLPTVFHYSWYDIERKITSYKTHWGKFWKSMYDLETEDTAENNVCFDKPWAEVTEQDIKELSKKLELKKGGHIFHSKINWGIKVPSITIKQKGPLNETS